MSDVAVVIPSLDGTVDALLASIARQTLQPVELAVVRGVRPNGRARNEGIAQTSAPIVVFIDDDATLGPDDALERMVAPLRTDPTIGATGAAKLLPPDAPPFQRRVAREVARIEHDVVHEPLETNPEPPHYYCDITTTCCALRRSVIAQIGGFDDALLRGVDTEFFVRLRRASEPASGQRYRLVLVPHVWAYHPAPGTFAALMRKQFYYGYGHAQEVQRDPARGRPLRTFPQVAAFLAFRTAIVLPNIVLPYSHAAPSWRPGFKPLKALASYASALGYAWGWVQQSGRAPGP